MSADGLFSLLFILKLFTLLQAIYVPADDLTDPAPATTFAHLDATTVLSRAIAELGIYPAVDPLDSTSRIMDPNIVGGEHYDVARGVQKILQASLMLDANELRTAFNNICNPKTKTKPCLFFLGLQIIAGHHCYPGYG